MANLEPQRAERLRMYLSASVAMFLCWPILLTRCPNSLSCCTETSQELPTKMKTFWNPQKETPFTFGKNNANWFFDKGGTLRYRGTVDDNFEDPAAVKSHYVRGALEAVLAGQEPPTTETTPVGCTIKWK